MPMLIARWPVVALVIATMWSACAPARALDSVDLSVSGDAALAGPGSSRAGDADDDEDTFFSGSANRRMTTGTIASAGMAPAAAARPLVDVVATCRAVLADNLNFYNYKFIEGCKRAIRANLRR